MASILITKLSTGQSQLYRDWTGEPVVAVFIERQDKSGDLQHGNDLFNIKIVEDGHEVYNDKSQRQELQCQVS